VDHLDPRAPLVLDTRELGRRAGAMKLLDLTVPAPADLGTAVIGVPSGSDVELDLRLESVIDGVLVSGTARVRTVGECSRCLDPVVADMVVDLQELYEHPEEDHRGRVVYDAPDDEDPLPRLVGDLLDLEPTLRDAVVLALPLAPVCRDDCPGLCVECGARLADEPDHHHDAVDPRWAALAGLAGGDQHDPHDPTNAEHDEKEEG
jgi:uncharacterized protein